MSGSMPVSSTPTTWPSPKRPWLKMGVVWPPPRPDWPTHTVVSFSSTRRGSTSAQNTSGMRTTASRCWTISAGEASRRMREKNGLSCEPTTFSPRSSSARTTRLRSASG